MGSPSYLPPGPPEPGALPCSTGSTAHAGLAFLVRGVCMAVDHPPVTVNPTEYVSDSQIQTMCGVGAADAGLRMSIQTV